MRNFIFVLVLSSSLLGHCQPKKTSSKKTDSLTYTVLKTDTITSKDGNYVVVQKINQFNSPLDSLKMYFDVHNKKYKSEGYFIGKLKETKEWYTDSVLILKEQIIYWDNKKKKETTSWYPNGSKKHCFSYNAQGMNNGWQKGWHLNGKPEFLSFYNDDGKVLRKITYRKNGKIESTYTNNLSLGIIKHTIGNIDGESYLIEYYRDKCLVKSKTYKKNELVKLIETKNDTAKVKTFDKREGIKVAYYNCCDCFGFLNLFSTTGAEPYLFKINYFKNKQLYKRELYKNRKVIKTINY